MPAESEQQWRQWAQSEIGGPEGRVEIALKAVLTALDEGRSADDAASAARHAADSWEDSTAGFSEAKELFRGRVTSFQQRLQTRRFYMVPTGMPAPNILVWDFRLERTTSSEEPLSPVAVELRSPGSLFSSTKGFRGCILNGDFVEVDGREYKRGEVLCVEQVHNRTSNTIVRISGESPLDTFTNQIVERYGEMYGRVSAMQQMQDIRNYRLTIWNFRLKRIGQDGQLLPTVEVEMRGRDFRGSIADGDEVRLDGTGFKTGDVVQAKQLHNFGLNSVVKPRGWLFG